MNRNKYQRLTKEEKDMIRKMTLEGKSLNKISKLTSLGKTTIYYNVKKYKPRQWRKLIVNLSKEKIGELMGAFSGDGSYYYSKHKTGGGNHKIRYSLSLSKDIIYAEYLRSLLRQLNLNPFLCYKRKENVVDVLVQSKGYINFIREYLTWEGKRTYSIRLKNNLDKYSKEFLIGFVRGLMDTDGFVETHNVSCGCTSERLIRNLAEIYDKFGIKYKLTKKIKKEPRKDLFLIRAKLVSLKNYHNIFGFSNHYKLEALKKILKRMYGDAGI